MISDGASPPTTGGGGSSGVGGETASDMCPQDEDTCNTDGSTNFIYRDELTYKATDGKFYGTLITNQCNDHVRESLDGTAMPGNNAVSCIDQTIPAPDVTPVSPIPLLGRAALTLSGGVNIYSAFEGEKEEESGGASKSGEILLQEGWMVTAVGVLVRTAL